MKRPSPSDRSRPCALDAPQRLLDAWQRTHAARPFTWFVRAALFAAFVPSGLKKILGWPFTSLPASTPVGEFFWALYHTGAYYRALGAAQLLAAVLILFPRSAAVGAMLYLAVTINIFGITHAVDFGVGTGLVTTLMLLASLYLVAWEYPRWRSLLGPAPDGRSPRHSSTTRHPEREGARWDGG